VPAKVYDVLLNRHVFPGPAPDRAESGPEMLTAGHDGVVVLEHVVNRYRAHSEARRLDHCWNLELSRQEGHGGWMAGEPCAGKRGTMSVTGAKLPGPAGSRRVASRAQAVAARRDAPRRREPASLKV
jgi:hypothetical protein